MPTQRLGPGVAALDNKIYVTGGYDGGQNGGKSMSSVDCYDPGTKTWSLVESMHTARRGHGLFSLHGKLYAIGGEDVDSVEVFDPENSTWTWFQIKMLISCNMIL